VLGADVPCEGSALGGLGELVNALEDLVDVLGDDGQVMGERHLFDLPRLTLPRSVKLGLSLHFRAFFPLRNLRIKRRT